MQTVRRKSPGVAAPGLRCVPPSSAGFALLALLLATPTSRSPPFPTFRPTTVCATRSRSPKPTIRWKCSSAPIAASSMRDAARGSVGICADLEARGHRGSCWSIFRLAPATSTRRPRRCDQSARSSPQAACRRTVSPCAAIIRRPGAVWRRSASAIRKFDAQAGPCGLWPEDIGPSFNRDYFENQPVWNLRLRDAAQPRRHGRQSGGSRAAARRDAALRNAAHGGRGKIPVGHCQRYDRIRTSDTAKISDLGK